MPENYTPMDRSYYGENPQFERRTEQQATIFPISSIGQTVPEVDPSTGGRIIQNVDAAIKAGTGNLQIVMSVVGQTSGMGGGPKAYGEEVREALREIQKASGAKITGVELPTQINNLSGFTQEGFSEEQQKVALDEVRDAIKFVGDISGGGGVNIVSFEFARNFDDMDKSWWNKDSKNFQQRERPIARLVDTKDGKLFAIDKKKDYYLPYDRNGNLSKTEENKFNWNQIEDLAKKNKYDSGEKFLLEEYQTKRQLEKIESEKIYLEELKEDAQERVRRKLFEEKQQQFMNNVKSEEDAKKAETSFRNYISKDFENDFNKEFAKRSSRFDENLRSLRLQEKELKEEAGKYEDVVEYGVKKAAEGYAQAGIWAMEESMKNQFVKRGKGSVHVGPEMGWPQYYGSHPQEWVDLILKSRQEMTQRLEQQGLSHKEAEEAAKKHIKGEVDTSHMGMWFQHFKPELSYDKRITEFKSWYKNQIEFLAEQNKKHDIIGEIQVVDSATGAHGHLPVGQGILGKDLFEYMKILKEKGNYKGEFTSEGHEEEVFGKGRILSKAWEAFGAPVSSGYWGGQAAPSFGSIRNAQAMSSYGATGIYRSYVPSNDFTLWSGIEFE